jgi:hypothetical protein
VESASRTKSICEQIQNNVLCVATASDGKTMAVGTRTGEVHLWSTGLISEPPLLKSFCRFMINSHSGARRKQIVNLPISQNLIKYLLYQDFQVK